MIAVRCPFCHIGLKVDEGKLPSGIVTFPCPKCKKNIPVSILKAETPAVGQEAETLLVGAAKTSSGRLTVVANADTPGQVYPLSEGICIVGRKSGSSPATIAISTADRTMSRAHVRVEVKKDVKGGYKHFLSDNNSKNRTLYNSRCLEEGEIVVLKDNDEIMLGQTVLRFNE